ncbi:hypothetical protein PR003_g21157 [Phytophthora rubi]|nr:hypothetical protein PR001_g20043 [Phytophthora rubi]KAE9306789.1 hypothetical protein PR003_g21157 [Phytophthora rubi]
MNQNSATSHCTSSCVELTTDELMGSEDEVEFAALKKHVMQVFRNAGLKALLDELRQIQQGPSGRELVHRLACSCVECGITLLHEAAELFGVPLVDYLRPGVPEVKLYSREEFSRRFAEGEALALTVCRFLVDEAGAAVNFRADGNMAEETALERTIVQGCEPIAKFLNATYYQVHFFRVSRTTY